MENFLGFQRIAKHFNTLKFVYNIATNIAKPNACKAKAISSTFVVVLVFIILNCFSLFYIYFLRHFLQIIKRNV